MRNRLPELDAAMSALFRRYPALCGFSVHEMRMAPTREVVFEDVAVHPWAGHKASPDLVHELAGALLELAEQRPGTPELVAGRTFAPAIH